MGEHLRSGRARWGVAALAAVVLGLAAVMALPAGAGPEGASAPRGDGPTFEAHGPRSTAGDGQAAAAAPLAAALAGNLTYTTTEPCRTFDSRQADGPIGFGFGYVLDLLTPCGLPDDGSVKAVVANVISVSATGTGYVRAAAFDPAMTSPGATVLNFNKGLVSSNAIPLTICDPAVMGTCEWDLDIWVPSPATTNVVLDIVGYFS